MELERNFGPLFLMPIRIYLDGQKKFDDESIRRMGSAFETALASLGATRGYEDPVRAKLARRIIALIQAGEHDPERLCEGACGRSALLFHPLRAAKPAKLEVPLGKYFIAAFPNPLRLRASPVAHRGSSS